MKRFLLIALLSIPLGAGITFIFPTWQNTLMSPDEVRDIGNRMIELTVGAKNESNKYLVFHDADAREIERRSEFVLSKGTTLVESSCSVTPGNIVWTTTSGRTKTTHTAPGLTIRLKGKIKPTPAAAALGWSEISWGGSAIDDLKKLGWLEVQNRQFDLSGSHYRLVRNPVVAAGLAHTVALAKEALLAGLPFAVALTFLGGLLLAFPKNAHEPLLPPHRLPMQFMCRYTGLKTDIVVWIGIPVFVACFMGVITLLDAEKASDAESNMRLVAWITLAVVVYTLCVVPLLFRKLRQVLVAQEGIVVRGGAKGVELLQSRWGDLKNLVAMEKRKKDSVVEEWLEVTGADGKKINISADQICDYQMLRDVSLQMKQQSPPPLPGQIQTS
ncbi:MAG: hypothetical protein JNM99_10215 [Verrucomicrobiaceae bacterium]|nr:hypothetical protein [Verrucomicrobiaceae bacterium]